MLKFVIFVLFSFNAFGISLEEIRTMAVERSITLKAEELELQALQSESEVKGRWQNPQLMGQFGNLKSGPTQGFTAEVSVTQSVPLSDKYTLKKELAQLATSSKEKENIYFKNWISHQALLSVWRLYISNELFRHGQERAKRLKLVKSYMESRPRVSIRLRVELSLIESMLMQLERMQDEKELELKSAVINLEFWTGKRIIAEELSLKLMDASEVKNEFELKITEDTEIQKANAEYKMSVLESEISLKERRPDLYLGGGYRVENVSPVNYFSYGIVGLNIPIWDTGHDKLQLSNARKRRNKFLLLEAEKKAELKQKELMGSIANSYQQLKRFPVKLIERNEKIIHEAETGFKQGVVDVNTFLQVETQTHEVIDQVFLSWLSYLENLSLLQLMRGEEFVWAK